MYKSQAMGEEGQEDAKNLGVFERFRASGVQEAVVEQWNWGPFMGRFSRAFACTRNKTHGVAKPLVLLTVPAERTASSHRVVAMARGSFG